MLEKVYPVTHSDAEWRRILTADQFDVMRGHGTEAPGSCALLTEKRAGRFSCAGCAQPLFDSRLKFESGTDGPASTIRSKARSRPPSIGVMAWSGPRCIARTAAATSGTSSPTVRRPPISAIASTASQ